MNKKITIDVTKADITKSQQGSESSCAIARAAKRQGYTEAFVDDTLDVTTKDGKMFSGKLPAPIHRWISKFDDATKSELKELKPFSFSVTLKEVND